MTRPRVRRSGVPLSGAAEAMIDEAPAAAGQPHEHIPTANSRRIVREAAAFGFTNIEIGVLLGVSEPTVAKYYPDELTKGKIHVNMKVARRMFQRAMSNDKEGLIAGMFFLKARAGWKDNHQIISKVEVSGPNDGPIQSQELGSVGTLSHEERAIRLLQILNASAISGPGQPDPFGSPSMAPAPRSSD